MDFDPSSSELPETPNESVAAVSVCYDRLIT